MPFARRMFFTMFMGNLGGALLTFVYFRFLDPAAHEGVNPLQLAEIFYFLGAFSLMLLTGRVVSRRWSRSVIRASGPLPDDAESVLLRRRAVMVPVFLASLTFSGWVVAALVWGVIWPWFAGYLAWDSSLRQAFGIVFVAGAMVALFIFLASERLWRERLPILFPTGDLAATGARHLRVRTRMVVVFLMMSIVPMLVLSVATVVRVRSMRGMDFDTARVALTNLITVQSVLVGIGLLLALTLAWFVSDSVAKPLRKLQSAMGQVEQGQLDVRCPVVSNDEIGSVTEGFNRMVTGLRERETIREAFGRYVSPEVRDEILAGRASLGGAQREVTILFADIRGFSTWAEASPAVEVVQGLNAYFTEMDIAIRANGGLVLQFRGTLLFK